MLLRFASAVQKISLKYVNLSERYRNLQTFLLLLIFITGKHWKGQENGELGYSNDTVQSTHVQQGKFPVD